MWPGDGSRVSGFSGLMLAAADGMLCVPWSDIFDKAYLAADHHNSYNPRAGQVEEEDPDVAGGQGRPETS